jgi:hypothetical protein
LSARAAALVPLLLVPLLLVPLLLVPLLLVPLLLVPLFVVPVPRFSTAEDGVISPRDNVRARRTPSMDERPS